MKKGMGCLNLDVLSRRNFLKAGVLATALFGLLEAQAHEIVEIETGDSPFSLLRSNGPYSNGFVNVNYERPGGLVPEGRSLDPTYYIYFTNQQNDSETYLTANGDPSVGFNTFFNNGYRVRAKSGDRGGKMNLEFGPRAIMGGFYQGNNPDISSIVDGRDVRIEVEHGEVSSVRLPEPKWYCPVVTWGKGSRGFIQTGNVRVDVDNGRLRVNELAMRPVIYGATPLVVRSLDSCHEVLVRHDGRTTRQENPER